MANHTAADEHAQNVPAGAFYDDLVAMIFAFHAFEAYLNYAGEKVAPEIWQDERSYFKNDPYRGFDGKMRKVLELVGLPEPDRLVKPYSTVWLLKGFRDLIVHGKFEKISTVVEHSTNQEASWVRTPLDDLVTTVNAERARDDIFEFAKIIHDAARSKVNDVWFGNQAFDGPHSESSRSKPHNSS